MTLQEEMIRYRAKHRMSLREFAEEAGLSLQTVHYVERGLQNPLPITEQKIRLVLEKDEGNETEHQQNQTV